MRKYKQPWARRAGVVISAAVTMAMLSSGAAFAAQPSTVMATDGYVTSATTPASQPVPEILGLSSIEESNGVLSTIKYDDWTNKAWSLKYILMGSSEFNSNPNPYFNNVFAGDGKVPVYNKQHDGMTPKVTRPMAALLPYASALDTDGSDTAVWNMLPDVIIGCRTTSSTTTDYSGEEFAPAAGAANGVKDYSPVAIDYNMSTLASIVNNAYLTAQAADQIVANSNGTKFLRYGSAVQIVKTYESYVKGSQGYILKQLANDPTATRKTFAIVSAEADGTCTLTATPGTWGSNTRIGEALYAVADNYADENGTSATIQDLVANVDLIIINASANTDTIATDLGAAQSKTYWVTGGSTNRGQIYHNASNSMDVATHYGRIMSCLYPEYLDQSDMVAFFYEQFYHVKSSALGSAIDQAMDGVRNWDGNATTGMLEWTADTVAGYNTAAVQAKLTEGVNYISSLTAAQIEEMGSKAADLVLLNENFGGADGVAAFNVSTQIKALPDTITAADKAKVDAARQAYNALTEAQQALVDPAAVEKLAQSEATHTASIVAPASVKSGETFTVPVVMKAVGGVLSGTEATFEYDKDALELISITAGKGLAGKDLSFDNVAGSPLFTFYANTSDATNGIEIALATFKAKSPAADTTIALDDIVAATSGEVADIDVEGVATQLSILTNGTRGDINNNGSINIVDAQLVYDLAIAQDGLVDKVLAKFEAGSTWNTTQWIADFNEDNYVSANDARAIMVHTLS